MSILTPTGPILPMALIAKKYSPGPYITHGSRQQLAWLHQIMRWEISHYVDVSGYADQDQFITDSAFACGAKRIVYFCTHWSKTHAKAIFNIKKRATNVQLVVILENLPVGIELMKRTISGLGCQWVLKEKINNKEQFERLFV